MKYSIPSFNQLLQPQMLDRTALAATALLAILLGHGLAGLTWSLLPQSVQAPPPPAAVERAAPARNDAAANYQRLAGLSLFGEARPDDVAQTAPIDAPDTRLNLTLRGILFNSHGEGARAIIAAPGRQDEHYRIGQEVTRGASIERIFSDRVILLREGQYETLRLPEDRLENVAGGTQPQARPRGQAGRQAAPQRSAPPAGGGSEQDLSQYRQQLLERPDEASRYLRAEPVNRDGGLAGFRVSPGPDTQLFDLAGLQEGDIVTEINGVQLDQFDKGFEAMEQLAAAEQLTLTVLRGGQQQTIQLQLRN